MKNFVVWLDSKSAHIFALEPSGTKKSVVKKSEMDHHTHHKKEQHTDSNAEHYYRDLAKHLKGADQILLMGPGLAKNHFREHLATHEAGTLAKKIIGIENLEGFEHESENQMMAKAHQFFKKYDLMNSSI